MQTEILAHERYLLHSKTHSSRRSRIEGGVQPVWVDALLLTYNNATMT